MKSEESKIKEEIEKLQQEVNWTEFKIEKSEIWNPMQPGEDLENELRPMKDELAERKNNLEKVKLKLDEKKKELESEAEETNKNRTFILLCTFVLHIFVPMIINYASNHYLVEYLKNCLLSSFNHFSLKMLWASMLIFIIWYLGGMVYLLLTG